MASESTPAPGEADRLPLLELRSMPSARLWGVEIERIVDGVRDHILDHLGDAAAYVEMVLQNSADPQLSRLLFFEALDYAVTRWSPGRGDETMIDLLHRFTPAAGYLRLIEALGSPYTFGVDPDPFSPAPVRPDLRRRALHALERYFPCPPLDSPDTVRTPTQQQTEQNYQTYQSILRAHLAYPRYAEYARQRLQVLAARVPQPETPPPHSPEQLIAAYRASLRDGSADRFLAQLDAMAVEVSLDWDAVTIAGLRAPIPSEPPSDHYALHFSLFARRNPFEESIERLLSVG